MYLPRVFLLSGVGVSLVLIRAYQAQLLPARAMINGTFDGDVSLPSRTDLQMSRTPLSDREIPSQVRAHIPDQTIENQTRSITALPTRDISLFRTSWHVFWNLWIPFAPSENTTLIIAEMYTQMYAVALDALASKARRQTGSFSYGDFQLVFSATNNQIVPWDILGDFMQIMQNRLIRGLVGGMYQATIYTVLGVSIWLIFMSATAIVMMEMSVDLNAIQAAQKLKMLLVA